MKSFYPERCTDLQDRGVPLQLALTASRMHVWRKPWNHEIIAWHANQTRERIVDLDWIEYVPEHESALAILDSTDHRYAPGDL